MVVGRILQLLRWIFCVGVFVVVLSVAVVREFVMFGILISVKVMIYVEVLCCVSRCVLRCVFLSERLLLDCPYSQPLRRPNA